MDKIIYLKNADKCRLRELKWAGMTVKNTSRLQKAPTMCFFSFFLESGHLLKKMQLRASNIVQNTVVQKAAHHSNLIPTLDSTIAAVLDQVAIFDFQLGPDLNCEQFWSHCICDLATLSTVCFTGKKH